mmetsp:Transcript_104119/g.303997  ORF Transcript_104119/g.303997 Transcript_104119/m.303997 type:complete len:368 (+) Transcript_104119:135-1238(+)
MFREASANDTEHKDLVGVPVLATTPNLQLSVGSQHHDVGRCKPCAFFHTKGCTSGVKCVFCHLCPVHEKQRRKRLRRQICNDLMSSYNMRPPHHDQQTKQQGHGKHRQSPKLPGQAAGHARQNSDASNRTCSTTCTGLMSSEERGQNSREHSRQWSVSTQDSTNGSPSSPSNLNSMVLQQEQSMYVFNPAPQQQQQLMSPVGVMQPLVFFMPPPSPSVATHPVDASARWRDPVRGDRDDSWEPVPEPAVDEAGHAGWSRSGRDAHGTGAPEMWRDAVAPHLAPGQMQQHKALPAAGYVSCNGMQYALVPVAPQPYPSGGDHAMQPPPAMPPSAQAELSYGQSIGRGWLDKPPAPAAGGAAPGSTWWP